MKEHVKETVTNSEKVILAEMRAEMQGKARCGGEQGVYSVLFRLICIDWECISSRGVMDCFNNACQCCHSNRFQLVTYGCTSTVACRPDLIILAIKIYRTNYALQP